MNAPPSSHCSLRSTRTSRFLRIGWSGELLDTVWLFETGLLNYARENRRT
jgi:hypothetical protein